MHSKQVTPQDLIRYVERGTGHRLNDDEGVTFGPRTRAITGLTLCWTITPQVVESAVAAGHNCILHHEWLTFFCPFWGSRERHEISWHANNTRLKLLAQYDLTTLRIHGSADELHVYEVTARQLGLGEPIGDDGSGIYCRKLFASPVPTFGELLDHVKNRMKMPLVRVSCHDADRPARSIGMPWGGMGLFINIDYIQALIDAGADTLICGETDAWAFRFAVESGVAVIETSHEESETLGLSRFAADLGEQFDIPVAYVHTPAVWTIR